MDCFKFNRIIVSNTLVFHLTINYSETINESDKSLELEPKLPDSVIVQEGDRDDDNEAEISEYLTLAQLGNILRELAVKGKTYKCCIILISYI